MWIAIGVFALRRKLLAIHCVSNINWRSLSLLYLWSGVLCQLTFRPSHCDFERSVCHLERGQCVKNAFQICVGGHVSTRPDVSQTRCLPDQVPPGPGVLQTRCPPGHVVLETSCPPGHVVLGPNVPARTGCPPTAKHLSKLSAGSGWHHSEIESLLSTLTQRMACRHAVLLLTSS